MPKKQVKKEKVQNKVKNIIVGSITDLSIFDDNSFDAVICLGGPISHLKSDKEIWKVWLEAHYKFCTRPEIVGISEHMLIVCRKI